MLILEMPCVLRLICGIITGHAGKGMYVISWGNNTDTRPSQSGKSGERWSRGKNRKHSVVGYFPCEIFMKMLPHTEKNCVEKG